MKIGVSIDGVLRDLLGQIEETHKKYFTEEGEEDFSRRRIRPSHNGI
jgi:hypothetical protein